MVIWEKVKDSLMDAEEHEAASAFGDLFEVIFPKLQNGIHHLYAGLKILTKGWEQHNLPDKWFHEMSVFCRAYESVARTMEDLNAGHPRRAVDLLHMLDHELYSLRYTDAEWTRTRKPIYYCVHMTWIRLLWVLNEEKIY